MSDELATKESVSLVPMSEIGQLIQTAIQTPEFDPKAFQLLLEQKRIEEDREAERAFLKAKALFQRDCPEVPHDKVGRTDKGMKWTYASLGLIEKIVKPHCGKHGLSYSWTERGGRQFCVLAHRDGHHEESSFTLSTDGQQGALSRMTRQQQEGATDTYARGRSLTAVLGIGTAQLDTGGATAGSAEKPTAPKQSHSETCKKIREDWLTPRHELHDSTDAEKHRRFGAWFISCTDATTFSPVVSRWTAAQLMQCRQQLDKEAAAAKYASSELPVAPSDHEESEPSIAEGEADE